MPCKVWPLPASDQQPPARTQTAAGNLGLDPILDSEVVPPSLVEIAPILHVANEIESSNPRLAFICRFFAFEKAHKLDRHSNGQGVCRFKEALYQRLQREDEATSAGKRQNHVREIQSFYQHYYKKYSQALHNATDKDKSVYDPILDSEVVPPSLVEIAPILQVANEIGSSNPRVAFLCRFYSFEKAHKLDPSCNGCGVRTFKTALLQRLERENESTLASRAKCDAQEIKSFYQNYIQVLQTAADKRIAQLTKEYHTAYVLFEILKEIHLVQGVEVSDEILETQKRFEDYLKIQDSVTSYRILETLILLLANLHICLNKLEA